MTISRVTVCRITVNRMTEQIRRMTLWRMTLSRMTNQNDESPQNDIRLDGTLKNEKQNRMPPRSIWNSSKIIHRRIAFTRNTLIIMTLCLAAHHKMTLNEMTCRRSVCQLFQHNCKLTTAIWSVCHSAECRYIDCRGALRGTWQQFFLPFGSN
jgi:hypothetical protein